MFTATSVEKLLLFRDANLLVLNKPSGMAVHPGKGPLPDLTSYLEMLRFGLPQKPELAHRLDAATSGCLVLGRHRQALKRLGLLFSTEQLDKTYVALVHGKMPEPEGVIDLPLAKQSAKSYQWWMKVDPISGKEAKTKYTVLTTSETHSLVELNPLTGRTHQLRVHCAAVGAPIVGDKIYGRDTVLRLCLHAIAIKIPYYPKKQALRVLAPLPEMLKDTFRLFGIDLSLVRGELFGEHF